MAEPVDRAWAISAFDWGAEGVISKKDARDPEVRKALGQQFEALLIGQMLRSMREAGGSSWAGSEGGEAGLGLMEMAEQQLALAMAAAGGLGLAKMADQALGGEPGRTEGQDARSGAQDAVGQAVKR
ncbi:MAG: hypothetical protein NZR01_09650 [Bryobacteraceae bacterium]|nr:hypothetical protein [Bryobacteraceae bacterium]